MPLPIENKEYYTVEDFYNCVEEEFVELIDGHIYNMTAPNRIHQKITTKMIQRIANYIDSNNGDCEVYPAPFAVLLDVTKDTVVEPDISVICDKNKLTDRGCTGAPDWIIEVVSPSNYSHDYIDKLNLYHQAGVREYWIVNPMDEKTTVYNLQEEVSPKVYDFDESIQVGIYENLSICVRDFL
ncbi:Uma2 family endonuclease [Butyrivibrio sp. XPD2002]|uniref:Uma2 family endonuclease n=1 Tax=Butyrivibrio sp. XPD2002 TaxID=1280665 RepID=UPI0004130E1A|nr:Uma2 family endonuclease [Butyrivibrio sp. XPD2002]